MRPLFPAALPPYLLMSGSVGLYLPASVSVALYVSSSRYVTRPSVSASLRGRGGEEAKACCGVMRCIVTHCKVLS